MAACPNHPAPSNSTSTTLQTQPCLTLSIPPPTPWSTLIHLLNHLTPSGKKTCPLYPCPSSWPLHLAHTHPSPQNTPMPLHHGRSTQTSPPITPHNTHVDLPMRGHALSPSIAAWTMTQSKTPLQSWTSISRPKHLHKQGHTPTTMFTQELHTVASSWRNWNLTSPGCTASCSNLSTHHWSGRGTIPDGPRSYPEDGSRKAPTYPEEPGGLKHYTLYGCGRPF